MTVVSDFPRANAIQGLKTELFSNMTRSIRFEDVCERTSRSLAVASVIIQETTAKMSDGSMRPRSILGRLRGNCGKGSRI